CSPDYSFHTWRAPGSSFVFDVQADSHLDERANEQLYMRTLENELSDKPDFLIDLGDTFMTEKLPGKETGAVLQQYLRQRTDLSIIGHSVPLYLVLGNHDGEAGYSTDNGRNTLAPLSLQFRKQYFPNPEPDGFYTGNSVNDSVTGKKQDYYAWEWGDALFVVLDPYWYTTAKPGGTADGWAWTLGETQYQWLEQTLQKSNATYKFVFAHQLVGGDSQGRGGTEFASLYEWGGKNPDGSWGFDQQRPGWGVPIHQLLVDNNVTAFFHGHDHFFDKQEIDGIVYQEVPQPATISPSGASPGAEYGYVSGVSLGSPGHLIITVSPESARVDYIRSHLPGENKSGEQNGAVVYSYSLTPEVTP
ncbi:MAG: metallophosphoesterase family protein, partial [Methanomicrobiales archaeon]